MKSPYVKLDVERYDELIELEKEYENKVARLNENRFEISKGWFNRATVIYNPTKIQAEMAKILLNYEFSNKKATRDIKNAQHALDLVKKRVMELKRILGLTLMVLLTSLALIIHLLLDL